MTATDRKTTKIGERSLCRNYNGYSQLAEQDFFELDSHDVEDMSLADRINIHYKIGNFTKVSFDSEEQDFLKMVEGECHRAMQFAADAENDVESLNELDIIRNKLRARIS